MILGAVSRRRPVALAVLVMTIVACGGSDAAPADSERTDSSPAAEVGDDPGLAGDVLAAIDAVEAEIGTGQEFFEVTANEQFTNVFVAVDDATAAVAYAFVDGELQPPAPKQDGAEGNTFTRDDVSFDPEAVIAGVRAELPESTVDAISVYGDGAGATYVVAVTSAAGGFLDVVVGPDGQVFSVDPV